MPEEQNARKIPKPKEKIIRVVPDDEGFKMPRAYANFALVAYAADDFTVYFCDVQDVGPDNMHVRMQDEVYKAPVVAKIALSPSFVPKLIKALRANYERCEKKAKA